MFASAIAIAAGVAGMPQAAVAVPINAETSVTDLSSGGGWNGTLSEIGFNQLVAPGTLTDSITAILTFPGAQTLYTYAASSGSASQRLYLGEGYAGALRIEAGVKVSISGNTTSGTNGGALYLSQNALFAVFGSASTGAELALEGNRARNGGGIYIGNLVAQTLTFGPNVRLSGNTATDGSGGGLFANADLDLRNTGALVFENNAASSNGGAIFSRGTLTVGSGLVFKGNHATAAGGAVSAGNFTGGNGLGFTDNRSDTSGGAINAEASVVLGGDAVFLRNVATGQGDGGAVNAMSLTLGDNARFEANEAKNGGAIFLTAADTATLTLGKSAVFTGNSASDVGGGAIRAKNGLAIVSTGIVLFEGNKAVSGASGGVLYVNGALAISAAATFSGNTAAANGGAILAVGAVSLAANSAFAGNQATGNGGAIYTLGSVTLGDNTTFGGTASGEGNRGANGGAIYLAGAAGNLAAGANTSFTNNGASGSGGAIYSIASLSVTGSGAPVFTGNTADSHSMGGGAVFANGALSFATGGVFTENAANNSSGGVIYARGDVALGGGSSFSLNTAGTSQATGCNGGAIYLEGETLNVGAGAAFSQNTAANSGGAVHGNGKLTLLGSAEIVFEGNRALAGNGGALSINGPLALNSDGGSAAFTENTAGASGGAIHTSGAASFEGGVSFSKNIAELDGGALHAAGAVTFGDGATFTDNKATGGSGGAIHTEGASLVLNNPSTFARNSAGGAAGGGAIHAANATGLAIAHTGALAFTANKATGGGGGAIAATGGVSLHGNTLFKNNESAAGLGGAIHAASIALNADQGDIHFTGNTEGGAPGAVALTGGASSLTGAAGRAIVFDDPLHHATGATAVTLALNTGGGAALVQFAGTSTINAAATTTGGISLAGGSLRVLAGAVLDAGGSPFNAASGSSVLGAGTISSVAAAPIRIAGIVAPDARRYVPDADLSKPGTLVGGDYATLTLDGAADLSGANIQLQIQPQEAGPSDKLVVHGTLVLDEGSSINVTGSTSGNNGSYDGPVILPLVETDGGVSGFPKAELNIPTTLSPDDFLNVAVGLDSTGKNIVLQTTLAWYGTNPKFDPPPDMRAHGHFTLAADQLFTVNVALNDHSNNISDAWALESAPGNPGGRVLTKLGPGTLVLAASGDYSGGTRLEQGVLRLAAEGAAGTGTIAAASSTSLVLDFTGTFSNIVSGLATADGTSRGNVSVPAGRSVAIPALAAGGVNITAANFDNAGIVSGGGATGATAGRFSLATLNNKAGASFTASSITVSDTLTNHGEVSAAVVNGTLVNGAEGASAAVPVVTVSDSLTGSVINRGMVRAATVNTPSAFDLSTPLVLNYGEFTADVVFGTVHNTGVFAATTVNAPASSLPADMPLITNTGTLTATTINGAVLNGAAAATAASLTADAVSGGVTNHGVLNVRSLTGDIVNTGSYNVGVVPAVVSTVKGLVDNSGTFNAGIINAPDAGLPDGRVALVQNSGELTASVINGALINTGTASLGAVNGDVRNSGTIRLRDTARWGALDNAGGTVRFEHAGNRLTVASLAAGTGAERGSYFMDVSHYDLVASDILAVEGNISGEHHFVLTNTSNPEANLDKTPVVSAPRNVNLLDEHVTGEMVTPLYEYNFMEDDNGGYMLAKTSIYGPGATVAANTVGALSMEWFSQLHNIDLRLGDLRLNAERIFPIKDYGGDVENDDAHGIHNGSAGKATKNPPRLHGRRPPNPVGIWTRAYGQRINADLGITGVKNFREYQYGADVGGDREFVPNTRNLLYAGGFAGYQGATRDFRDKYGSHGFTDSVVAGAYGAWLHESGLFVESVFKVQYYMSEYSALNDKAKFENPGVGLSVRLGYRWNLPALFYVEPDLSVAYLHLFGTKYDTQNHLRVNLGDSDIRSFSANLRAGKLFDIGSLGLFQPYLRAGIEGQSSDSSGVRIGILNLHPNTDGTRCHLGLGFAWQVDVRQQIHFDYQYSFGDKYTRPFAFTIGYRRLF